MIRIDPRIASGAAIGPHARQQRRRNPRSSLRRAARAGMRPCCGRTHRRGGGGCVCAHAKCATMESRYARPFSSLWGNALYGERHSSDVFANSDMQNRCIGATHSTASNIRAMHSRILTGRTGASLECRAQSCRGLGKKVSRTIMTHTLIHTRIHFFSFGGPRKIIADSKAARTGASPPRPSK